MFWSCSVPEKHFDLGKVLISFVFTNHTFNPVSSTSTSSNRMKTMLGSPDVAEIEKLEIPRTRNALKNIILKTSYDVERIKMNKCICFLR